MKIWKEFTFDAAHRLPDLPPDHPCSRLHGHTYRIRVHLQGKLDPRLGWIVDFAVIKEAVVPVCTILDHHYLNQIDGLFTPTAEVLARWIYNELMGTALKPWLYAIELFESSTTGVWYEPE